VAILNRPINPTRTQPGIFESDLTCMGLGRKLVDPPDPIVKWVGYGFV